VLQGNTNTIGLDLPAEGGVNSAANPVAASRLGTGTVCFLGEVIEPLA